MFCRNCGSQVREGAQFCSNCGTAQNVQSAEQGQNSQPWENSAPQQPVCYTPEPARATVEGPAHNGKVSFGKAIELFFKNYANFEGRASLSEYWWACLFTVLIGLIPVVSYIAALVFLVPSLAITVRRLHDIGKSWTYILMGLIPFAGAIILLIAMCKGSDGDNQWGPGPVA